MSFSVKVILAAGALFLVAVGFLFLRSDSKNAELERTVDALLEAVEKRDVEACLKCVDPAFDDEGRTYADVEREARQVLEESVFQSFELRERTVEAEGSEGRVRLLVDVRVGVGLYGKKIPYEVQVRFRKGSAGWKISGYRVTEENAGN